MKTPIRFYTKYTIQLPLFPILRYNHKDLIVIPCQVQRCSGKDIKHKIRENKRSTSYWLLIFELSARILLMWKVSYLKWNRQLTMRCKRDWTRSSNRKLCPKEKKKDLLQPRKSQRALAGELWPLHKENKSKSDSFKFTPGKNIFLQLWRWRHRLHPP